MTEFPYSFAAARIKEFIEQIPAVGVPEKVTIKELEKRGFKSSNDRNIIPILKHIGLTDESGVPSEEWKAYRNRSTNRALMARLVRLAYSELFELYADASTCSDSELRDFMSTKTSSGERVVQAMVATFKTLCSLADFESEASVDEDALGQDNVDARADVTPPMQERAGRSGSSVSTGITNSGVTVHFHLHLSENTAAEQIETVLSGVAHHLLGREVSGKSQTKRAKSPAQDEAEDIEELELPFAG